MGTKVTNDPYLIQLAMVSMSCCMRQSLDSTVIVGLSVLGRKAHVLKAPIITMVCGPMSPVVWPGVVQMWSVPPFRWSL